MLQRWGIIRCLITKLLYFSANPGESPRALQAVEMGITHPALKCRHFWSGARQPLNSHTAQSNNLRQAMKSSHCRDGGRWDWIFHENLSESASDLLISLYSKDEIVKFIMKCLQGRAGAEPRLFGVTTSLGSALSSALAPAAPSTCVLG